MSDQRSRVAALAVLAGLAALLLAEPALACSVCFGEPNSAMGQGVRAGIFVLLGVAGAVLTGVASLLVFWWRRAARLEASTRSLASG
jgi:hypothetical protein